MTSEAATRSGELSTSTPAREGALGQTAARGAWWTIAGIVLSKLSTSITLVVIGLKLDAKELGLYATALAASGFMNVLKDGGATSLLIQRGERQYETLAGPVYWLSFTLNCVSAAIMALMAWPLAMWVYKDEALVPLLLVLSSAVPMIALGSVLNAKLQMDMRFAAASRNQAISGVVRQAMVIVLALLGFKAMALAIPAVAAAALDAALGYWSTRDKVWRRPARVREWPGLLRQGWWTVGALLANFAIDQGAVAAMGAILVRRLGNIEASKAEVGLFNFAFQMTAQIGTLLGWGMQQVLFPILARLNDEPDRQRSAIVRSLHAMMILGSLACIGLAVTMRPIEQIVWHGKWSASVAAVVILGIFFPWRVTFGLTTAALQAQGRFKRHAILTGLEGLAVVVATCAACLIPEHPGATSVAWYVGGSLLISRAAVTCHVLARAGVSLGGMLEALLPAWLAALVAGWSAWRIDSLLGTSGIVRVWFGAASDGRWAVTAGEAASLLVRGGSCVLIFLLIARIVLKEQMRDAASLAPVRLRGLALRILLLNDDAPRTKESA